MERKRQQEQQGQTREASPLEELLQRPVKEVLEVQPALTADYVLKSIALDKTAPPVTQKEWQYLTACPFCGCIHWPYDGSEDGNRYQRRQGIARFV